jgi:hypothetical protein
MPFCLLFGTEATPEEIKNESLRLQKLNKSKKLM